MPVYNRNVFINCPFDDSYRPLFDAMLFSIADCGFRVRCSLEVDDASEVRVNKILRIINDCSLGIHDISRTELDPVTHLPRFNMPLELGMFLGAKHFGDSTQRRKACMILDRERFRFQQFISDIGGQDPHAHHNDPTQLIVLVRDWLASNVRRTLLPGGDAITRRFQKYQQDLPDMCRALDLKVTTLTYTDRTSLITGWLRTNTK